MPEVKYPIKVYAQDYKCDECQLGYMRPINKPPLMLNGGRPLLAHACTNCRKEKHFPTQLPFIVYEMPEHMKPKDKKDDKKDKGVILGED